MSLQVLHLIGGGEIGGAEHNVLNLLTGFPRDKVNPFLGCLVKNSPLAALTSSKRICTEIFPMRFPLDILPVIPLIRFCRNNKIGLIHCHGVRANLIGRITARLLSIPAISTVHSLPEYDYPSSWKGKFALLLDNKTLSLSSGIITVSDNLRVAVSQRIKSRTRDLPIKTIYNGIPWLDFANQEIMRTEFRHKWNIPQEKTVIGTIGRLHPVKGQIYLAEAMELLIKEYPHLHLLIIGEGPIRPQLQDLLASNKLPYTMTGYLPSAWKALPAMDIFLLPSLSEGMGLVLLEAAQAKIPIIASSTGGIPELFAGEREILLCKPADPLDLTLACSRILENDDLAKTLVQNAYQRAMKFTVDKMVNDTTDFYLEITKASMSYYSS